MHFEGEKRSRRRAARFFPFGQALYTDTRRGGTIENNNSVIRGTAYFGKSFHKIKRTFDFVQTVVYIGFNAFSGKKPVLNFAVNNDLYFDVLIKSEECLSIISLILPPCLCGGFSYPKKSFFHNMYIIKYITKKTASGFLNNFFACIFNICLL